MQEWWGGKASDAKEGEVGGWGLGKYGGGGGEGHGGGGGCTWASTSFSSSRSSGVVLASASIFSITSAVSCQKLGEMGRRKFEKGRGGDSKEG